MKAKLFIFAFLILSTISLLIPQKTHAQEQASGSSATLSSLLVERGQDHRAEILRKYLEKHDSPLAQYADVFVSQADLYQLDWRFVAAISGVESTFGKAVPCTNAWGWNIPNKEHIYCFGSYDEGIRTISKTLREKYINEWGEDTIYSIGRSYAASPTWASRVNYFMNDMQDFAISQNQPLSISL
ncbi:MAG TPA: hypothetical protein VF189_02130 [Patescibacteria group bacterium]